MDKNREKLIELLVQAEHAMDGICQNHRCESCPASDKTYCAEALIAEHLISNGVTFARDTDVPSKWVSVDHPPENWKGEGGYLTNFYVYTPEYGVDIRNYMRPANKWLCMGIPCNVTHWMPLPQPPKEEPK